MCPFARFFGMPNPTSLTSNSARPPTPRSPPQTERVPLASVMTLIPKYFPPELYVRRARLSFLLSAVIV